MQPSNTGASGTEQSEWDPVGSPKLRARIASFIAVEVLPRESELDESGTDVLGVLQDRARAAGLWALPLPTAYGGQGVALGDYLRLAEAEGASDHGPSALGSTTLLDCTMYDRYGSDAVRAYLPPLVAGHVRAAFAMTEPDTTGSDPSMSQTVAVPTVTGSWRLTGRKWFVTGGGEADLFTVLARTSGDVGERAGLSLFVVRADTPGVRKIREVTALGAGGQWEIAFDAVEVPADHVLAEPGEGLRIASTRLQLGRTLRCLRWLGQAERAFGLMCDRARTRQQASGPLSERQLVQQHVFESLLAIRGTRALVHAAADRLVAGQDAAIETGLAKVAAARTLYQVADSAIQVYGAAGLGPDTALPALLRTGRLARILDGPDELHIGTVARRLLR